jgi:hypothetical protein
LLCQAKGRTRINLLLAGTALAAIGVVAWLIGTESSSTPPGDGVTIVNGPRIQPAQTFPALNCSSSDHLPTKLNGFQLGMSVAEALSRDSNLENVDSSKGKPSGADPNAFLKEQRSDGSFIKLSFSHGRLAVISSDVSGISAEDGEAFDRNTLNQLGTPQVDVYQGPDTKNWIWIDGDVRIKYENRPEGMTHYGNSGPRIVSLEVCVYPQLIALPGGEDPLFRYLWGDGTGPVVLKPLPEGFGNLRLRSAPWQVRQAIPGIDISTTSAQEEISQRVIIKLA